MKKIFIEAQWYPETPTWRAHVGERMPTVPGSDSPLAALAEEGAQKGWYSRTAHPEDYEVTHGPNIMYTTCGFYFGDESKTAQAQEYIQKRIALESELPCVPGSSRLVFCEENEHPGDSYIGADEVVTLARDHL